MHIQLSVAYVLVELLVVVPYAASGTGHLIARAHHQTSRQYYRDHIAPYATSVLDIAYHANSPVQDT
eukprot:2980292-Rhodomonas_salina.2